MFNRKSLALVLVLGSVVPAFADTLVEWDRNGDDTDHYNAYYCIVRGCTVTKASTKSPNIPQVPVANIPQFVLPLDTEGNIAITATDGAQNESGLSVSVPFDKRAPLVPLNPRTR